MGKNHNSRFIENFGYQNSLYFSLNYQCYHTILSLNPLFNKKHYMKVHEVNIH
jgi:hypothetical protein